MRRKIHDIIAISNSLCDPDIFITMTASACWYEVENTSVAGKRVVDRPDVQFGHLGVMKLQQQ